MTLAFLKAFCDWLQERAWDFGEMLLGWFLLALLFGIIIAIGATFLIGLSAIIDGSWNCTGVSP